MLDFATHQQETDGLAMRIDALERNLLEGDFFANFRRGKSLRFADESGKDRATLGKERIKKIQAHKEQAITQQTVCQNSPANLRLQVMLLQKITSQEMPSSNNKNEF